MGAVEIQRFRCTLQCSHGLTAVDFEAQMNNSSSHPQEIIDRVIRMHAEGYSFSEISRTLSVEYPGKNLSKDVVQKIGRKHEKMIDLVQSPLPADFYIAPDEPRSSFDGILDEEFGVPEGMTAPSEDPMHLPSNSAVVLSDFHIPHHNAPMIRRALGCAKYKYPHIRHCVINGDFFNFDSPSAHPKNGPSTDPDTTIRIGGDVLRSVMRVFDHLWIVNGNHDERIAKAVNANFRLDLLINAALGENRPTNCVLHVSNLDYMYVGDKWLVGHPSSYSGQGGKTPSELANLFERNVIAAHNHIVGVSQSKNGKYIGVDSGHLTAPGGHYYLLRRLTKFTQWNSGFVVIDNGYAYPYTEAFTDWSALGF